MALVSEIKNTIWTLDMNNAGKIVQGVDAIRQNILIICTTQKGTDPLRPDFGCSAFEFIDLPVNIAVPRMVKSILEAIKKYEPNATDVKVTLQNEFEKFTFKISFKIINTTINDQLNITYG